MNSSVLFRENKDLHQMSINSSIILIFTYTSHNAFVTFQYRCHTTSIALIHVHSWWNILLSRSVILYLMTDKIINNSVNRVEGNFSFEHTVKI